jgi:ribosomal protein S27AE
MITEKTETPESLGSPLGSPPHLAEETIGEVIRWIDREHITAARENPPNRDYMSAMQRLGDQIEGILKCYRKARSRTTTHRINRPLPKNGEADCPQCGAKKSVARHNSLWTCHKCGFSEIVDEDREDHSANTTTQGGR